MKLVTPASYSHHYRRIMPALLEVLSFQCNNDRHRPVVNALALLNTYRGRKPNTSQRHPAHRVYPYLLRHLAITRSTQVWGADITYIPMARGFVYLFAVLDAESLSRPRS